MRVPIRVPIRAAGFPRRRAAAIAAAVALAAASCAQGVPVSPAASRPAGATTSSAADVTASGATAPATVGSEAPVPTGNGLVIALPTDEPKSLVSAAPVPSCGAMVSFEVDPDVSPAPTAPAPVTSTAANDAAMRCLIGAWSAHRPAMLVTDETTDEQDRIYTVYRLPGDGSVDVVVRLDSHTEKTVTWTETTCRSLAIQDDRVTPSDCTSEQIIR